MSTDRSKTGAVDSSSALRSGLEKVDRMIEVGRRLGYTEAASNLENWRDARGDRVMPATSFASEKFFLGHLRNKHRPQFVQGARRRLASGVLNPGGTVEMDWTDSVNAPIHSDLWFALGGFTVHSRVRVQVIRTLPGRLELRFLLWRADISDDYNWDAGKATWIPGIGTVSDNEMRALEKAGYGKAFRITSESATIVDREVVQNGHLSG